MTMQVRTKQNAAGEKLFQIVASAGPGSETLPWRTLGEIKALLAESDAALRSRGFGDPAMVRRIWAKHNSQPVRRPGATS